MVIPLANNDWVDLPSDSGWQDVPDVSVRSDVAQTLLPSVARSITGISGAPGDINEMAKSAASWLLKQMGATKAADALTSSQSMLPTTQQLQSGVEKVTGPLYQPQTTLGQITDKAIQFAPGVMGGPETLLGKAAMTVLPAAASVGAGKAAVAAGYPEMAPIAELGGALASPYGVKALSTPGAISKARDALLTTAEMGTERASLYNKMNAAGVVIKPEAYKRLATDLYDQFKGSNYRLLVTYPPVAREIGKIIDDAKSQVGPTLSDFTDLKTTLGRMSQDPKPENARQAMLAGKAYATIQDFWKNLKAPDIISNTPSDPTVGLRLKQEADKLYTQEKKAQLLDQFVAMARKKKNVNYSASGDENAIRQTVGRLDEAFIKNKGPLAYEAQFFTPAEREQLVKTAEGSPVHNFIRKLGKLSLADRFGQTIAATLGAGGAMTHAAMGADPYSGLLWAGALAAPGHAARVVSEQWTRHNLRKALDMIHSGGVPLNYSSTPYPVGLLPIADLAAAREMQSK